MVSTRIEAFSYKEPERPRLFQGLHSDVVRIIFNFCKPSEINNLKLINRATRVFINDHFFTEEERRLLKKISRVHKLFLNDKGLETKFISAIFQLKVAQLLKGFKKNESFKSYPILDLKKCVNLENMVFSYNDDNIHLIVNRLTYKHLSHPIMRGKTPDNYPFLAFRVNIQNFHTRKIEASGVVLFKINKRKIWSFTLSQSLSLGATPETREMIRQLIEFGHSSTNGVLDQEKQAMVYKKTIALR